MSEPHGPQNCQPDPGRPPPITRRGFIKTAMLAGGAAVLVGVPSGVYFTAPSLKKGVGRWIDFGPSEEVMQENFSMLTYEFMVKDGWLVLPQRGFVWATSDRQGKHKVFSSTCTHLACRVIWNEEKRIFECPCHSGRFDDQGHPLTGPPTRPLSILESKVEEGNLLVYMT